MGFTCPACDTTLASESKLAGSAGKLSSTVRVSTAMTPTGIPPRRALPQTTVWAHDDIISSNEPLSKNPDSHSSGWSGFFLSLQATFILILSSCHHSKMLNYSTISKLHSINYSSRYIWLIKLTIRYSTSHISSVILSCDFNKLILELSWKQVWFKRSFHDLNGIKESQISKSD